ncbi:(2Fe-2S)-binding protein [Actinokineospora auranticolor]|uniref:FhuF-like iron-sulfur protein n=1 Tax=Actinokineospora auranticolor TaxID=155976 RepID=A0A2S6GGN6_9PSEU|nr:(2Fe-2S)-binding protein [Actinokineospora auranticolor]PPK64387.1 FhuF-like iron-sulfur protein [Actinokineospora auranticolor]
MTDARGVYSILDRKLPHHAGSATAGLVPVPVSQVGDETWLTAQITAAARMYRCDDRKTLGVLWWYSASSVLLAPTVESLVVTSHALSPSRVTLYLHPDGRLLAARSDTTTPTPGDDLRETLDTAITAIAKRTGAAPRALWAIATDSLANRALWAGGTPERAKSIAAEVKELPVPRFVQVNGRDYVRRGSCCLIYEAATSPKCVSCPRQLPEERIARLRTL